VTLTRDTRDLGLEVPRTEARASRRARRLWRPRRVTLHAVLLLFCLSILLPLAWVLLLSLRSVPDSYSGHIWPGQWDFTNYSYALLHIQTLPRNFLNSVMVTFSSIVITTVCAVLAGYALVHWRSRGLGLVFALLVGSMFFPTQITAVIGIWQIQDSLGLVNTTYGLIPPYVTLSLALCVFIMRGIFETIPKELADAARMDGCGPWRMLWHVMLPLIRNGIVVVIIVCFVSSWGEYLLALTLTNDQEVRTLPVVLASAFGGVGEWAWSRIAAVYVMAIAPGLIGFALTQRWYMKGLQEGALRG
jgi:ABC-type glycerol-3-phosphate transport system permease component